MATDKSEAEKVDVDESCKLLPSEGGRYKGKSNPGGRGEPRPYRGKSKDEEHRLKPVPHLFGG